MLLNCWVEGRISVRHSEVGPACGFSHMVFGGMFCFELKLHDETEGGKEGGRWNDDLALNEGLFSWSVWTFMEQDGCIGTRRIIGTRRNIGTSIL